MQSSESNLSSNPMSENDRLLNNKLAEFRRYAASRQVSEIIVQPKPPGKVELQEAREPSPKIQKPQSGKSIKRKKHINTRADVSVDDMVAWMKSHQPCTAAQIAKGLWLSPSTVRNRLNQLEGQGVVTAHEERVKGDTRASKFFVVNEVVSA